jgi:hypothetical protein
MHLLVVWAAVYLVWALGLGPDWRRYRVALAVTAAWAVTVYAFNVVVGTNYGYLNAKPSARRRSTCSGPWPWYVLNEIVIVAASGRSSPGRGRAGRGSRTTGPARPSRRRPASRPRHDSGASD